MNIYIASDHAGFEMKEFLLKELSKNDNTVIDLGADSFDESDDYPDLISPLAVQISSDAKNNLHSFGIILGGSGQGEAMVANRFSHVRAGVYNSENLELLKLLRQHNDANVLSLGARFISNSHALEAVKLFITTDFSHDPRHERRIKEIDLDCE
jgi:ribose 5-phosphate isomerase B